MILYCVIHTINQKNRFNNIKLTWGKDKNIIFYGDYEDLNNNIYKVSDNTHYSSGQEKQINIFQLLKTKFNEYEWYCFVDNDTFINTSLLEKDLKDFNSNKIHGYIKNNCKLYPGMQHPSGGAGFLIHKNVIKKLWDYTFTLVPDLIWSDVAIGLIANDLGIKFQKHNNMFNMYQPSRYNVDVKTCYSFHYIKDYVTMDNLLVLTNKVSTDFM